MVQSGCSQASDEELQQIRTDYPCQHWLIIAVMLTSLANHDKFQHVMHERVEQECMTGQLTKKTAIASTPAHLPQLSAITWELQKLGAAV